MVIAVFLVRIVGESGNLTGSAGQRLFLPHEAVISKQRRHGPEQRPLVMSSAAIMDQVDTRTHGRTGEFNSTVVFNVSKLD